MPTLTKYLLLTKNVKFTSEHLDREFSDNDIRKICSSGLKHIHLVTAKEKYASFLNKIDGCERTKLKKYRERTHNVIKLQNLSSFSPHSAFKLLKSKINGGYDKIIVSSKNYDDVNVLDQFVITFTKDFKIDNDGLVKINSFENNINEIIKDNKSIFESYSDEE